MMERNRQELLLLNSEVLKQIRSSKKNGEITLKGSVVYRDGKIFLKIREMQDFSSTSANNPAYQNDPKQGEDYEIFLREENLTEIPVDAEARVEQKPGSRPD